MKISLSSALALVLLADSPSRSAGQSCPQHTTCGDCLADSDCGSWYDGPGCYNRCIIADIACYNTKAGGTATEVCARADTTKANKAICSGQTDCAGCTSTALSGDDGGTCAWHTSAKSDDQYCGPPGCTMMGCGDADPSNCPAGATAEEAGSEADAEDVPCPKHTTCDACLADPACGSKGSLGGSWYNGSGCYDRCIIADIPCYRAGIATDSTPDQVCAQAAADEANDAICSAQKDCAGCTSTELSGDEGGTCAWFSRISSNQFCGKPGCTMVGCGDADPSNCPAGAGPAGAEAPADDSPKGDFKLVMLEEDNNLCVSISSGRKKNLKLAECRNLAAHVARAVAVPWALSAQTQPGVAQHRSNAPIPFSQPNLVPLPTYLTTTTTILHPCQ